VSQKINRTGQFGLCLCALVLLQLLALPFITDIWFVDLGRLYHQITGYALLIAMLAAWVYPSVRLLGANRHQLERLKRWHEMIGVAVIGIVLMHVPIPKKHFLLGLHIGLLLLSATAWCHPKYLGTWAARYAKTWAVVHIGLAVLCSGLALTHIYFIYAFAA
jgi:hypothetical protein